MDRASGTQMINSGSISGRVKPKTIKIAEEGTNNIMPKAQRNKAQRTFQPVKAQRQLNAQFKFFNSEAQRNFRNKLFDSVEAQRNSERHFRTKLKRNLTSAIKISQHNANTAVFAILV